jgi:putative zinc finger protein
MTCDRVTERLDDYLDGELGEAEFQEVELHLAGCAACRDEERSLRAVVAMAAALPRRQEPSRDLWPEIAEEIARRRRFTLLRGAAARPGLYWAAGLAAAATLAAVVWLAPRSTPPAPMAAGPTPDPAVQRVSYGGGVETLAKAERDYERATAELMAALDTRRASLSPETSASIDENLRVIDQALAEIRAALEKDPASPRLGHMLTSTHEKKIETLRRVLKLTT